MQDAKPIAMIVCTTKWRSRPENERILKGQQNFGYDCVYILVGSSSGGMRGCPTVCLPYRHDGTRDLLMAPVSHNEFQCNLMERFECF